MVQAPVILGGAAIAALYWQGRAQMGAGSAPVPSKPPIAGSNNSIPVGIKSQLLATRGMGGLVAVGGKGASLPNPLVSAGGGSWTNVADTAVRQELRAIEAKAKEEYDKLTSSAKKAAAKALNEKMGVGLTGEETWEEACKKVGASVGATVGVAACNAIPIPGVATVLAHTACATLGAMVGAYLGEKLGAWAKDIYNDVKSWADRQWDRAGDKLEEFGDDVKDAAEDVVDFVKFW